MSIGDAEIKTQERVIRFFKDPEILGYQYIGNLSDYQNKNIKEDRLRQYLRLKGYACLLYTSPSPRDIGLSRMPSSA